MADLYPLLLLPEFHERVWGSRDLTSLFPSHNGGGRPIGEAWLTGGDCRVANGYLAGMTLDILCDKFGDEFLGREPLSHPLPEQDAVSAVRFPLLIKILFPREKLSVQVHPDDEGARKVGQPCGKTECWYVLEAEPGAKVGLGLKNGTTKPEVERAIHENRMEQLLNWIDIHPGEMIYVDAGTIHAIGPGSVMVETQQNSDTTYRLYDYGRPRELHLAAGLEAAKERTHAGKVPREGHNGHVNLVSAPCFEIDKFELAGKNHFFSELEKSKSPHCLVALRGGGVVEVEGKQPVSFARGEVVVVPVGMVYRVKPQWELECYRAMKPASRVEHPRTMGLESGP